MIKKDFINGNDIEMKGEKEKMFDSIESLCEYLLKENTKTNKNLEQKAEQSKEEGKNDIIKKDRKNEKRRLNNFKNKTFYKTNNQQKKKNNNTTNAMKLKKGDKIKIIQGNYKVLANRECKFIDYCEGMNKVLLQLDKLNSIYVNPEDIEKIVPVIKQYEIYDKISKESKIVCISKNNEEKMFTVYLKDDPIYHYTIKQGFIKKLGEKDLIKYCYNKIKIIQYMKQNTYIEHSLHSKNDGTTTLNK